MKKEGNVEEGRKREKGRVKRKAGREGRGGGRRVESRRRRICLFRKINTP